MREIGDGHQERALNGERSFVVEGNINEKTLITFPERGDTITCLDSAGDGWFQLGEVD